MSVQWTVSEGSHAFVTVYWYDEDGAAVTPTAATYRLDDVASGQAILAATSISSLSTSNLLTITPAQNTILRSKNRFEERRLTVVFTYSSGAKTGTGEFVYAIKNLFGV